MEKEPYRTAPRAASSGRATDVPSSVLDALSLLHEQALQEQALSKKAKELIALATSVVTGCDAGIAYHLHNALEAGATRQEMVEAVEVAVVTMGEPAAVHAAQILRALAPDETNADGTGMEGMAARAAAHPYMPPD